MQLASLLQKRRRKKEDEEKGVGKAGSQESGDRREEEENLAREQVRQCSCSLVLCVCVVCRCTVNECIEDACSVCVCEYIQGILHVRWDVRVCLQQVDATVVQQVGGALCSLLHHLVLVDDLHCLVVNAQPAVKTDVEDIRGVMTACRTVSMVIHNW